MIFLWEKKCMGGQSSGLQSWFGEKPSASAELFAGYASPFQLSCSIPIHFSHLLLTVGVL